MISKILSHLGFIIKDSYLNLLFIIPLSYQGWIINHKSAKMKKQAMKAIARTCKCNVSLIFHLVYIICINNISKLYSVFFKYICFSFFSDKVVHLIEKLLIKMTQLKVLDDQQNPKFFFKVGFRRKRLCYFIQTPIRF